MNDKQQLSILLSIITTTRRELAKRQDDASKAQVAVLDHVLDMFNGGEPAGLTVSEAAAKLGVGLQTVLNYIKNGRLPASKGPNGRYIIQKSDIEKTIRPRMGRPPQEV